MPKRVNPDVQLILGAKTYLLRFSLKAFARLQDHFGLASIDAVGKRLGDAAQFSVGDMGAMLWAGLARHHPEVTLDQALDMADDLGMAGLTETFGDALGAALSEPAQGQGARPPKPGPSTATS